MSALYNSTKSNTGSYFLLETLVVSILYFLSIDKEDKNNTVYSVGFDRQGNFNSEKFSSSFDEKIKSTIIYIINEFFRKNGDKAILYFCYENDEFARHRSITFSKWHAESLAGKVLHIKKYTKFKDEMLYGGMLITKNNPLINLLDGAIDFYIEEVNNLKN